MKKIKFTIVTVCFNACNTISNAIKSVLSQSYDYYEYLIIDGKSTDSTITVIESLKDNHLTYISEPDKGIYDAMNKALQLATGDYLLFLGADDTLYSNQVLNEVANRIEDTSSVIYGDVLKLKTGSIYDGKFSKWDFGYKNICHQSVFYPRSIYKNKKYDIKYNLVADWVYNLELMSDNIPFNYIDVVVSNYNDIDGASSTRIDKNFLKNRRKLIISAVGILPYAWGIVCKSLNKIL